MQPHCREVEALPPNDIETMEALPEARRGKNEIQTRYTEEAQIMKKKIRRQSVFPYISETALELPKFQ
jgi:hypothetical protein